MREKVNKIINSIKDYALRQAALDLKHPPGGYLRQMTTSYYNK